MQNYGDWKNKIASSPIMEALNRGQNNTSTFGSVDQFLSGLLGNNFNTQKIVLEETVEKNDNIANNTEPHVNTIPLKNEPVKDHEEIEDEIEDEISNPSDDETVDLCLYKAYKDKEEIFECNISVQGAKLSSSQVRLIFDHEICNVIFYGKIGKDGKCVVPLKKMNFYPERSTGRVRLEVIVDDTIFIPWEETFIVEGAKKVTVQIKSQKKVDFRF
jgi:hypothetical protein